VLLLCASTVALYGFDDKEKKPAVKTKAAPAKSAPAKATSQVHNAPVTQSAHPSRNLTNRPLTTNPGVNNRPTTTNPGLNNRPLNTNPNLNNRPITPGNNTNLNNRPATPLNNRQNINTNLNNRPTATPLNNRGNISAGANNRATTPQGFRAPVVNTSHLPPDSQATRGAGGVTNVTTRAGGQYQLNAQGHMSSFHAPSGASASFRPNGAPRVVHTASGTTIIHNNYGGRTVIVNRPNNTVIVNNGGGRGYVQHPFSVGNRSYVQRTYVVNGVRSSRFYQSYNYHGHAYPYYVRARFYRPAFYGWAYNPWARPVAYGWGWGIGTPWFGFYGGYFQPYPMYRSPAFWLTDYLFSATLTAAYQERMADQAAIAAQANAAEQSQNQVQMSDQVKQMVADEVQRQLAQARNESQSAGQGAMAAAPGDGLPASFTDNAPHALVVSSGVDVNDGASGCALGEGDVVAFNGSLPPGADSMSVKVVASHGQDCPAGAMVAVQLQDLMEMQNHLRATLDQGMEQMQSNAGHGGLPAIPSGAAGYVDSPIASAAPPPDADAASELSSGAQQATQEEMAVLNQASDAGSADAGSAPAAGGGNSVSLGMSVDQVRGILGNMRLVATVGNKQIFQAGGLKITFLNGQVANVE
jgi:hypothetical protein